MNASRPIHFLERWLVWLPALLVIAAGYLSALADPDLWGYLAFGHLFWNQPGFPYADVFAYTPAHEVWIYHEWLTGVLFYPLYAAFGASSLQALRLLLVSGTLLLLLKTARLHQAPPWSPALALCLAGLALCAGWAPVRAQIFTILFFTLTLYVCESARVLGRSARLAWLVPVFAVWANLHGGFIAGLGLLFLFLLGGLFSKERAWPCALALAGCILSTLANPYGLDYWRFVAHAASMPRPEILEWMSTPQALASGFKILMPITVILLTAALAPLALLKRPRDPAVLLILAVTGAMAWLHVRHVVFFGAAFAAYAPGLWPGPAVRRTLSPARKAVQAGAALPLLLLLLCNFWAAGRHLIQPEHWISPFRLQALPVQQVEEGDPYYPIGAVDYLKKNGLNGNILTEFHWGEFILWSLPGSRVAMDGRYETVYTAQTSQAFFDFVNARPGWREYLANPLHQIAVFEPKSQARLLIGPEPGWEMRYADAGAVVFVRQGCF